MPSWPGQRPGMRTFKAPVKPTARRGGLGYGAAFLLFRLLLAVLMLLWLPYAEQGPGVLHTGMPPWQSLGLVVALYCLVSALVFAAARQSPEAHVLGSLIDTAWVTTLVMVSGGPTSPFAALYVALAALTAVHFGMVVGVAQGVLGGLLWLATCFGTGGGVPWLHAAFAAASPALVAVLASVLKRTDGPQEADDVRRVQAEAAGLAGRLCAIGAGAKAPRISPGGPTDRAWESLGARSVAVFARTPEGDLVLVQCRQAPSLSAEVGVLVLRDGAIAHLAAGTSSLEGDPGRLSDAPGLFVGWGRGEAVAITGRDREGRVALLAIAESRDPCFGALERQALDEMGRYVRSYFRSARGRVVSK